MSITIEKVLSAEQVHVARQKLAAAEWIDGRVTAGYQAQEVKRNAQVKEGSAASSEVGEMVLRCRCASFRRCSTATRAARRSARM
jgi:PKHD-type hydroxylase